MALGFSFHSESEIKCDTCGAIIPRGIISLSGHFVECSGKELFENVCKIDKMPLSTKDKMDLVKKEFNVEQ